MSKSKDADSKIPNVMLEDLKPAYSNTNSKSSKSKNKGDTFFDQLQKKHFDNYTGPRIVVFTGKKQYLNLVTDAKDRKNV